MVGNNERDSLKNNKIGQSAAKLRIGERSTTRVIVEPLYVVDAERQVRRL